MALSMSAYRSRLARIAQLFVRLSARSFSNQVFGAPEKGVFMPTETPVLYNRPWGKSSFREQKCGGQSRLLLEPHLV